ncbi:hypothetical protein DET50_11185 [Marinobacter pelagius]|uniref:Uncharacterized protein n=1 Tax=Marinobacter pelagius TaxID=379482 RepID=A0A366GMG5_9GAMM|nr:hypothetical protein [Marinobacter pelagius]RBP28581.1 hypothetical protein DET50_11185 [Marinobacter pelagius]
MRADSCSRIASGLRLTGLILLLTALVGCKTEKDPDQPTILGAPPSNAYLGVEYYYNWGAYGGEGILDYSLTNAPSWLALEDISNKARQGVIMYGVPGLTGGSRGEADLGKTEDINLVTTDGSLAGTMPFDIEVRYNPLALEAASFTEGEVPELAAPGGEHCALPDLSGAGEHTFTINTYDESGAVDGEKDVTLPTRQVAVKVTLDKPSVTRVGVAFELSSQYDPSRCDPSFTGTAPHQRCDFSAANASDAIIGKDIVGLGTSSPAPVDENGDPLGYLSYEADDNGYLTRGVVTLEPGITECYIRLEVVEDSFAELSESAQLTLTEVRSGLAGLGPNNGGVQTSITIDDNEPVVSLETLKGGPRDTLNVGDFREYRARLTGERYGIVQARLIHSESSTARLDSEFVIEQQESGLWVENPTLSFPADQDAVTFRVRVPVDSYTNPDLADRFIEMALDETYQAGREGYARPASEDLLRVSLNELTTPLVLPATGGFVPMDMALGHNGRLFLAGYDGADGNRVKVRIFDQKGNLLQEAGVTPEGVSLAPSSPVIAVVNRKVTENNTKVDRYEFLVAYSSDVEIAGTTPARGEDVLASVFRFDGDLNGGEYVPYWTLRSGTAGDDRIRDAGINPDSGYMILAGETSGTWPGQSSAGGVDSFLQRIDAVLDGDTPVPEVAWTRQVGSASDDAVAGSSVLSMSPMLFGSASGSVGGAEVIGGEDAYFYAYSGASTTPTVYQVGTAGDEKVAAGLFSGNNLWLLGESNGDYSVTTGEDDLQILAREPLSSQAGFLLSYSATGEVSRAFTLNDTTDASRESFHGLTGFGGDMVAGGETDGNFTGEAITSSGQTQGIVSRISLVEPVETDDSEPEFRNEWRYQLTTGATSVRRLANYRDDEITALVRSGEDRMIILFSPEGQLLTPLN